MTNRGRDIDQLITDKLTVRKRHHKSKASLSVEGDMVVKATAGTSTAPEYSNQSSLCIESTTTLPAVLRYFDSIGDITKATMIGDFSGSENLLKLSVFDDSSVLQNSLDLHETKTVLNANTEVGTSSANRSLTVYGNTTINGTLDPTTLSLGSYTNLETKISDMDSNIAGKHPTISSATNLHVNSIVSHGNAFLTLEGSTTDDYQATFQINDPGKDWSLTFPEASGSSATVLYDESALNADNISSGNLNEARLPVHSSLSAKLYINNTQQLITDTTKASYTGLYINGNSYFDGAVHTEQGIRLDDSGTIVPSSGNIAIEPVSTEVILKGNLRLHNDDLTAGPLLKAGDDSNITLTLPTTTGTLALKSSVDTNTTNISTNATNITSNDTDIATNTTNISTNTTNISVNTTKNVLEEIVLCPTTYDGSGNVETGSDINISTYVNRITTSGTPTLERLTAVQTLSSNDEVAIDGTGITYYLPPSDTKHLTISYDLQLSYSNSTSAMFSAIIIASFNGGSYFPIFNSIRGVGQASAYRMETITIQTTIHHNSTGTTEAYINRGLLNINNLSASDYWSFKLVGCRYHGGSSWGSVDLFEGHYFNSTMWSSSYLSGTPLLAPPHIRILATK